MSDSYTPPIKVNRINRNLGVKVHLYFNKNSHNRPSDTTPRFYLKVVELLSVEGVAFTSKSKDKYTEYGNRFWRYKEDSSLTNEQAESLFSELQQSYPYGYKEGDTASYNKYILDVKESDTFQSFYKRYWEDNSSKITNPKYKTDGTLEFPHPYIEILRDEIVTYKYITGTVPALENANLIDVDYTGNLNNYYTEPAGWACNAEGISVGTSGLHFVTEGFPIYSLKLQTSGRHRIDLVSSMNDTYYWPTGASTFSGYRWKLSTGVDGTHNGYDEYTSGVSYVVSPELGHFHTKVIAKTSFLGGADDTHPYYYSGHSSGFAMSGSGSGVTSTGINVSGYGYDEGPMLTLLKESTYRFYQDDSSNDGHQMYISSHPSGQNSFIYSSGTKYIGTAGTTGGYLQFDVPINAPSTLYYGCINHAYMGGIINIVDPPTAPKTGSVPGESIVIDSSGEADKLLYYYSPDKANMGGCVFMKTGCGGDVVFNS